MLIQSVFAAAREVFSPALRRILWKSIGLTMALLVLVWLGLTKLFDVFLTNHDLSASYPIIDSFAFFLAGFGLFVALIYLLPAVSAIVAGYFLDDVAEVVEGKDYPADPPGRALPFGTGPALRPPLRRPVAAGEPRRPAAVLHPRRQYRRVLRRQRLSARAGIFRAGGGPLLAGRRTWRGCAPSIAARCSPPAPWWRRWCSCRC